MVRTVDCDSRKSPGIKKQPFFIELIGPAGAGKTTLLKTLCQNSANFVRAPKPTIRKPENLAFFVCNALPLMPAFLKQRPTRSWFTWQQIWWMIYLNGYHQVLSQQRFNNHDLYVIDHGPIYMLASLRNFGPDISQNPCFHKWWDQAVKKWIAFLGMLIWLDAPNPILAKRINSRGTWHVVKGKPEQEIYAFLARYRMSFEQLISQSKANENHPSVLSFHTDREPPGQIAVKILHACEMHLEDVSQ